ncbi:dTMP kinase [Catellatospora coxensis]
MTIDGPGGTGKTSTAAALERPLTATGHHILRTQQPSRSPFGAYVRHALRTLNGLPLAHVVTADRYQHVHTDILPALTSGQTVIATATSPPSPWTRCAESQNRSCGISTRAYPSPTSQ